MSALAQLHAPHRPVVMVNGRPCTASGAVLLSATPFPTPPLTQDDELLQAALLEPRTAAPLPRFLRLVGDIWRWC